MPSDAMPVSQCSNYLSVGKKADVFNDGSSPKTSECFSGLWGIVECFHPVCR
jgi:hypothetical protein